MTTLHVTRASGQVDTFQVQPRSRSGVDLDYGFRVVDAGVLVFTEVVGTMDSEGAQRTRLRAISPHGPRGWVEAWT